MNEIKLKQPRNLINDIADALHASDASLDTVITVGEAIEPYTFGFNERAFINEGYARQEKLRPTSALSVNDVPDDLFLAELEIPQWRLAEEVV